MLILTPNSTIFALEPANIASASARFKVAMTSLRLEMIRYLGPATLYLRIGHWERGFDSQLPRQPVPGY